jgi:hypothetical protein
MGPAQFLSFSKSEEQAPPDNVKAISNISMLFTKYTYLF